MDKPQQPALFDGINPREEGPDQFHLAKFEELKHQLSNLIWGEYMAELMAVGWSWRKAAFVAWSICPKEMREPAGKGDFAAFVGVSRGTVSKWAGDQLLQAEIFKIRAEALAEHDQSVLNALVQSASNSSYKNAPDRRVFLEMRGYYTPRKDVSLSASAGHGDQADYTQLSEAELERQARLDATVGGDDDQ